MRGHAVTARHQRALQLCLGVLALLAFVAVHVSGFEVGADETAHRAHHTAQAGPGPIEPAAPDRGCDHNDGHGHDGAHDEVCVAAPRTAGQQLHPEHGVPLTTGWSATGALLVVGLRRRCRRFSPLRSPLSGRSILISHGVART